MKSRSVRRHHSPVWSAPLAVLIGVAMTAMGLVISPDEAGATGFEIPENTTRSIARGGTGAVNRRDPGALYFNPALLSRADGLQVLGNLSLMNLELEFQRDPLEQGDEETTFDPVTNQAGFSPVPSFGISYEVGSLNPAWDDNFAVGAGLFTPSSYSERCFGEEIEEGDCVPDRDGAARYMLIRSRLVELYPSLGFGYSVELPAGELSLGATAQLAYLDADFELALNAHPTDEDDQDPENDAIFRGLGMSDTTLTGVVGLAYQLGGVRAGLSYRPPLSWSAEGTAELEPPDAYEDEEVLTDDGITLETEQAGWLRAGLGYEGGTHPARPDLPRFDAEFNVVWEDWSRVEHFRMVPEGDLEFGPIERDLRPFYQQKGYRDTFSFRLGGSYGVNDWLTGSAGAAYETAAQPDEYTTVDFVTWERFAPGLGATFHPAKAWDIDLGYTHVFMPSRYVEDGQIRHHVPLSECYGPDYDDGACDEEGVPPGSPQNNGYWAASFQYLSVGVTYRYH